MIASTVHKVTNRVRQIVAARSQHGLTPESLTILDETLEKERASMVQLFTVIEDALRGVVDGPSNQDSEGEGELLQSWARRWQKVFQRKMAVEQAWTQDMLANPPPAPVAPVSASSVPSAVMQEKFVKQEGEDVKNGDVGGVKDEVVNGDTDGDRELVVE